MKVPTQAKLEVIVDIDTDQWAELHKQGYNDQELKSLLTSSITLREVNLRQPVRDIDGITLINLS